MKTANTFLIVGLLSTLGFAGCGSSGAASPKSSTPVAQPPEPTDVGNQSNTTESPPEQTPVAEKTTTPVSWALPWPTQPTRSVCIDLMAVEMAAYESAKPVFEEQCAGCHTPDANRKKPKKGIAHFSMASYPFAGHHSAELGKSIRASVGATDKPATMPQDDPGSLEGAELAAIVAWADAFDAASEAGLGYHATAAEGHGHKSKPGHKKHKSEHTKHKPKHTKHKPEHKSKPEHKKRKPEHKSKHKPEHKKH